MKEMRNWLAIVILIVLVAIITLAAPEKPAEDTALPKTTAPEIENIKNLKTEGEQGEELRKLLDRVGPVEAQEEMFRSGLPFTGETHLLIHVIGDYIYDNFGPEGLSLCREYFLSACYHGFIINTLADHGMGGMVEAMEKCETAPPGVFGQCAHAAGHGFLAWHDYELIKAAEMCDQLGEKVENFPYFNCYDGVFMENVWGVHGGKPSEKRWVKQDDIYYPCTDERIPEKYLPGCWSNQATLIYQYQDGDLKAVAQACDSVANETYRDICYNNFSRQIHPLTNGEKDEVKVLCANATGIERQEECMLTNMTSFWSVGDRVVPFELCADAREPLRNTCFTQLIASINYYYSGMPEEKERYCDKISIKAYEDKCKS